MARSRKEKQFASVCPPTDRIAYSKSMRKSCYNKSKHIAEAIVETNNSEAAKQDKQCYKDGNREKHNAQRREYTQ